MRPVERPTAPAVDALAHPVPHPCRARTRSARARRAHGAAAQRAVPHEHGHVAARRRLVDAGHVAGEAVPRRRLGAGVEAPEPCRARLEGHDARPAVADDVRGHALHDLEGHLGLEEHGEVVVGVDVDEAGRHGEAGGVELGPARARRSSRPRRCGRRARRRRRRARGRRCRRRRCPRGSRDRSPPPCSPPPGPAVASRAARAPASYATARWPRNRRAGRMPAMSQPAILPFVHAQGSWGEIGHTVGSMLAPLIADHVRGVDAPRRRGDGRRAPRAVHRGGRAVPRADRGARAVSVGGDRGHGARRRASPLEDLLLLQARAEVLRALKTSRVGAERPSARPSRWAAGARRVAACSSARTSTSRPFVEEFGVIVRQYPKGAPACLLYTSAGLVGHNGLNEAGVGICANFVNDPSGWGEGLPRYLLSRLALREASAEAALAAALRPPRAASRNLLHRRSPRAPSSTRSASGRRSGVIRGADDMLVHANHLEARGPLRARDAERELAPPPPAAAGADRGRRRAAHRGADPHLLSRPRRCARTASAPTPSTGATSRPWPRSSATSTRGELHVAKGSPCRAPYATYTLATCQTGALSVTVADPFAAVA